MSEMRFEEIGTELAVERLIHTGPDGVIRHTLVLCRLCSWRAAPDTGWPAVAQEHVVECHDVFVQVAIRAVKVGYATRREEMARGAGQHG